MPEPIDLSNLREMTDGDEELEKELFIEFISSTEKCISIMKDNISNRDNEQWKSTSHALKGTAFNLGAEQLGELCKKAQEQYDVSENEKQQILADIEAEYVNVKKFLETLY